MPYKSLCRNVHGGFTVGSRSENNPGSLHCRMDKPMNWTLTQWNSLVPITLTGMTLDYPRSQVQKIPFVTLLQRQHQRRDTRGSQAAVGRNSSGGVLGDETLLYLYPGVTSWLRAVVNTFTLCTRKGTFTVQKLYITKQLKRKLKQT
jgi:hypothetical protein